MTEDDDKNNAETIRRYKEEGGGALPRFNTHDQLRNHLIKMSDTELNRMRDFGCGKPHWSPYYVEPAYQIESRAIPGDKVSMMMTKPIKGEPGYESNPPSARSNSSKTANKAMQLSIKEMKAPDPMANTSFSEDLGGTNKAMESARTKEAKVIEAELKRKELEIMTLKAKLAATKKFK